MNFIDSLKLKFRNGDALFRLIFVNVAVFVVFQTLKIIFLLFNQEINPGVDLFAAPASLQLLIAKPWTALTYMFLHDGLFHILFNMYALYWFGKMFSVYFSQKQLVGLYILGGLMGFVFYTGVYNIFPYFKPLIDNSILLGASGSVVAIIVATATKSPNMEIRMLFVGAVKLKYVAIFTVLISFFGITSSNAGGEIAHLGGAFTGYLFIVSLQQGKDITAWLSKIFDFVTDLFKPRKLKVKKNNNFAGRKMSDAEYNQHKANRMKEIDRILDKIKTSGYESLSAEEKKRLFEQGNK